MDFLTGGRLDKAVQGVWGGQLASVLEWPLDPIAGGAVAVTTLLLALGLEVC